MYIYTHIERSGHIWTYMYGWIWMVSIDDNVGIARFYGFIYIYSSGKYPSMNIPNIVPIWFWQYH